MPQTTSEKSNICKDCESERLVSHKMWGAIIATNVGLLRSLGSPKSWILLFDRVT